MALSTTIARVELDGNAATTAFSYPYKYISASDLKVYLYDEDDLAGTLQTTGYTVAATGSATNGVYPGATITFSVAPGTDKKVVILNSPALTQGFDFDAEADPLPVLTRSADNDAMRFQALSSLISRAVHVDIGAVGFDASLPDRASADVGSALCLSGDKLALIWGQGIGGSTVSSTMEPFIASASLAAARTALGVGATDAPTFLGVNITPTAASTNQGLVISQSGPSDGTSLGSAFYYNDILVNGDQGNSSGTAYGLAVRMGVGGSNLQGQRTALLGRLVFNSASYASDALKVYAGMSGEFSSTANNSGSDTSTNAKGAGIGSYSSGILGNGGTYWQRLTGHEINTSIRTGGSARWHFGICLTQWADHAVSGAEIDAALHIVNQSGAVGWATDLIRFDASQSGSGTLVKSSAYLIRAVGSQSLTGGINISAFTFSGNAWASPGVTISGTGALAISRAGLPATFTNSTDAAANQGLIVASSRATPAANDSAYISLQMNSSTGVQREFARILALGQAVTNASETGQLRFSLIVSGSLTTMLLLGSNFLAPAANDLLSLGTAANSFSDLFLASGAVTNYNNGNLTVTHSAGVLTQTGTYVAAELRASGDVGGAASMTSLTNVSDVSANSTGVGTIKFKGATARDSAGFVKIYVATTAYYVPVFSAISG